MREQQYNNAELIYKIKKIKKLIDDKNYSLAWIVVDELLPKFSENEFLKFEMVRLYLMENKYKEALDLLEEIPDDRNFITQTELYIMFGDEDKQLIMYDKYFKKFNFDDPFYFQDTKYRMIYIYLNKKFNVDFELPSFLGTNYLEQQIYSYSKEKAIESIRTNHFDSSNIDKGVFYSNIDIEDMYERLDKFIKTTDLMGLMKYGRMVYRFYYPDCGVTKSGDKANGICVIISLGDREIITIFPSRMVCFDDVIGYYENKNVVRKKIKVRSGLERFNQRYNN